VRIRDKMCFMLQGMGALDLWALQESGFLLLSLYRKRLEQTRQLDLGPSVFLKNWLRRCAATEEQIAMRVVGDEGLRSR
jgi:hypothetical protein